jgi:hypothetical protein
LFFNLGVDERDRSRGVYVNRADPLISWAIKDAPRHSQLGVIGKHQDRVLGPLEKVIAPPIEVRRSIRRPGHRAREPAELTHQIL